MSPAARTERLQAMGLTLWRLRAGSGQMGAPSCGVAVEGGRGSVLLLCADSGDATRPVARDLARAVHGGSWGWPDGHGPGLEDAVAEQLLTRVLVFGEDVARRIFEGAAPERIGGAAVMVMPSLDVLAGDATARRGVWSTFVEHGLAAGQ